MATVVKVLGRPPVMLAVDDSPVTLVVLASFLEAANCQALTAQDGAQALELTYSARPELMPPDIQLWPPSLNEEPALAWALRRDR